ncbi:DUF3179 domain-containing protein [Natrarchaeobius oligotrophus]|uniref:DUF3179 domain-containing protein n=1 Tax=Natrarchaeobius chitinivorans TaxID=1679083 RepID=A0A3N6PUK4_NATCH|nr:DUF3179 domain-containing protein [Natrarchaeobius chitinivorans]RQH03476.1 DUF3179 domain-containing protein [Natrarchaeobius chitinivorans]
MDRRLSRRGALAIAAAGIAGCLDGSDAGTGVYDGNGEGNASAAEEMTATPDEDSIANSPVPIRDEQLPVEYGLESLREAVVRGVVPRDAIPSIDDPEFEPIDDVGDRIRDDDPVFGVRRGTDAKAYPQAILVHHEIVNDEVGGDPVAVTYCPLTGTAMGFDRGETTFGVSGHLLNSNLVMYDRASETYWPQMLATAIEGDLEAASLVEFPVVWTTWERWRSAHPDSVVLTEETGYARDYDADPYGSYNPVTGYYGEDSDWMFDPLEADDGRPPKEVLLCSRPADGPLAVSLEALRERGVYGIDRGDRDYLAAYDSELDVGYLYRTDDAEAFGADDGTVIGPDGERHDPGELLLEAVYAYDAMWFAWRGFYPSTSVHD